MLTHFMWAFSFSLVNFTPKHREYDIGGYTFMLHLKLNYLDYISDLLAQLLEYCKYLVFGADCDTTNIEYLNIYFHDVYT